MRVDVRFHDEGLELEIPEDRPVVEWHGPTGVVAGDVAKIVHASLETAHDYPPLRAGVVPGDRVAIVVGDEVPESSTIVDVIDRVLESAGVTANSITVLTGSEGHAPPQLAFPEGVVVRRHDPVDRTRLAYLASTSAGRRVYLNRELTDADLVVPVGSIAHDRALGCAGPWSVIFPGASDAETLEAFRSSAGERYHSSQPSASLEESMEVSWLLGSQFQVGVLPGRTGIVEVVSGLASAVLAAGTRSLDRVWSFRTGSRAELVVVGVGNPDQAGGWDQVAAALETAGRLVQHGAKIAVVSRASGTIGPAMRRLIAVDDPRQGPSALRGHEGDPDFAAARSLARALAWADVYLFSQFDRDVVEALSIIPLDRPEEVRRLAALAGSSLVVSDAERVRASVDDEAD
jgi:hypothetical protein